MQLVAQARPPTTSRRTSDDIAAQDFLIVTTNYDCLIERALDSAGVAYCVLAVPQERAAEHRAEFFSEYAGSILA